MSISDILGLGEVDKFSRQLETILDTLSEKGSNAITLGDMRNLIKSNLSFFFIKLKSNVFLFFTSFKSV